MVATVVRQQNSGISATRRSVVGVQSSPCFGILWLHGTPHHGDNSRLWDGWLPYSVRFLVMSSFANHYTCQMGTSDPKERF